MMSKTIGLKRSRLKVLQSGDPKTAFKSLSAERILAAYGPPNTLLSSSAKTKKCSKVDVLNRVLYLTPGVFCPAATDGCRKGCLGHTSGCMQLPSSALARDQRAALYLEDQDLFFQMLRVELMKLHWEAKRKVLVPAVRLNGTSDIPWEQLHPELFDEFEDIMFFDYTKLRPRMQQFLRGSATGHPWPKNYHLTFSADEKNRGDCTQLLQKGGNVAVVFHPALPKRWWGHQVVDGDTHDARFLDGSGVIVGLCAKGVAKVDLTGFLARPCPRCEEGSQELSLINAHEDTHRTLMHQCSLCGLKLRSRWILPHALKKPEDRLWSAA